MRVATTGVKTTFFNGPTGFGYKFKMEVFTVPHRFLQES